MEKSEVSGKLWGLTSGNVIGRVWSEDFLLLLNWWIQGYRVREFTFSHLNGTVQIESDKSGIVQSMRPELQGQTTEYELGVLISFVITDL